MKSKIKWLLASLIVPILIILLVLLRRGASIDSIFVSDLGAQYQYLFEWFKDVLDGKEILTYSFSKGLGGDMVHTYWYYLSSPFNLFLFFIPKIGIKYFIFILILLKIGLCGFTMYLYLDSKSSKLKNYEKFLLAISYALMSYNIVYYFNIIWLDIVYLAPIVLMGLDRIFHDKKPTLYVVSLVIAIISNYYMAYMLCFFLCIYFIYQCIRFNKKGKIKIWIKRFILYSLLAGLLSSCVLIPIIFEIPNIFRLISPPNHNFIRKFLSLLYNMQIHTQHKMYDYTIPYIHSTYFVVILIFNCLFNNKQSRKLFLLILLFFLSFFVINDSVWYFFSYPSGFLYRYSFLFVLGLIVWISDFYKPHPIKQGYIYIISLIYLIVGIITAYLLKKQFSLYFLFVNFYLLFSFFLMNNSAIRFQKKKYILTLFVLTIIELYISGNALFHTLGTKQVDEILKAHDNYHKISQIEDSYYRINSRSHFSIGKSTSSLFLSTNDRNIFEFNWKANSAISSSMYSFYDNDILVRLLGYQYQEDCDEKYNCKISKLSSTGIGYMIDNNSVKKPKNFIEYNYNFGKVLSKNADLLYKKYDYKRKSDNEFIIEGNGNQVVIDIDYDANEYIDVYLNGKRILKEYYHNNNFLKLHLNKGENILKIKGDSKSKYNIKVYQLEIDKLDALVKELQKETLLIEKMEKGYLRGNINVLSNRKTLLIAIPYQKEWNIYVDGKKTNFYKIYDTFIGLDLKKGNHQIVMKYENRTLRLGGFISLSVFMITIFIIIVSNRRKVFKNIEKK